MKTTKTRRSGNSLLLGMVYSDVMEPKRGQEYRDRVRSEAMEKLGYQVRTLDNKHSDINLQKHCTANFSDTRRMMRSIESKWKGEIFDHVILDYFFCPVGWARERWTDSLFTKTFPTLAQSGLLARNSKIWLPNLQCIEESLSDFEQELSPYFYITKVRDPKLNPLYAATEKVEIELLMCPDALTNETQLRPLLNFSDSPFYVLCTKHEYGKLPTFYASVTPPRKRNSMGSSTKRKVSSNFTDLVHEDNTIDRDPENTVIAIASTNETLSMSPPKQKMIRTEESQENYVVIDLC